MSNTDWQALEQLFRLIQQRKNADAGSSYTASLYAKGRKKIAQKVGEEAVELALAAVQDDKNEALNESADLLYHLCVLWSDMGIEPSEILTILQEREGTSGLQEKQNRKKQP